MSGQQSSKAGRVVPAQRQAPAVFQLRGRSYSLAEAGAVAASEQQLGNFQSAANIYDFILTHFPDQAVVHNNRGAVLQAMNRPAEALASYDRAIALQPDYANAHYNRGALLKLMGRNEEALASFERTIELKPDHADAHNSRGVILQDLKRYEDATASYDRAIAARAGYAEALNNRGTIMVTQGDMAEAGRMFRLAAELKPNFVDPLYNLANLQKYPGVEHPDVKAIQAMLDRTGVSPVEKESLYFALGKIYDDCDRYDEAFEYYRQGNALRNAQVHYDAAAVTRMTDELIRVFSRDFLAGPFAFGTGSEGATPLFIVGMPRSGTTLLAGILSNHPGIDLAGELTTLTHLTFGLPELVGDNVPYPMAAKQISKDLGAQLIQGYEARLKRDAAVGAKHVIDKYPLNFRHLGLITMLFPQARVIHCSRDPLDTGLSNYFQRFPLFLDYCFDLRNIGHFYREYLRLMEHWRTIPGLKMLEIRYEDMVASTEAVARRALDFLGLAWDERCLRPHTNPRAVDSASQWQVRQPIYDRSVGRWRHYEKHLGPLMEVLGIGG